MPSARQHLLIGLAIRLLLAVTLPSLLDDGLLLQGVRYTDIDYDVFTDAAHHVANGSSPYKRHTYRYTPFLAGLLALPCKYSQEGVVFSIMSTKYFGKILFCIADAICGFIIALLRRRQRATRQNSPQTAVFGLSTDFIDALWWLYNPLPINICTRGSAESLVVLLPVLATVAIAETHTTQPQTRQASSHWPIILRSCVAGIFHGIGIHAKLYPLIYTVSFMAYFSHQQQSSDHITIIKSNQTKPGWTNLLSETMQYLENCFCCGTSKSGGNTFPWRHPVRILVLAMLWVERLFFTLSSV
jgi:phosphatidylinositol glycan class M